MFDLDRIITIIDIEIEKRERLLEILNNMDFSEIEEEQQFIAENRELYEAHKRKVVYYREIPE